MYKVNHLGFESQGSHIYASTNLVYRFSAGGGDNRRRLWDR
jgi:hypothetical protein